MKCEIHGISGHLLVVTDINMVETAPRTDVVEIEELTLRIACTEFAQTVLVFQVYVSYRRVADVELGDGFLSPDVELRQLCSVHREVSKVFVVREVELRYVEAVAVERVKFGVASHVEQLYIIISAIETSELRKPGHVERREVVVVDGKSAELSIVTILQFVQSSVPEIQRI